MVDYTSERLRRKYAKAQDNDRIMHTYTRETHAKCTHEINGVMCFRSASPASEYAERCIDHDEVRQ